MNSLPVTESIRKACLKTNRLGLTIASLVGALVPIGIFSIAHTDGVLDRAQPLWAQPLAYLALGGLVYSALSVAAWTGRLHRNPVKGVVWTILVEGLMTLAPEQLAWLSWVCLAYLVCINAISNGCNAALDRSESHKERRARRPSRDFDASDTSGVHSVSRAA